ncbi:hypothetical protein PR202_gb23733 [Eleusine coracana subsp. coracana]|uniref:Uncharacterized protein n=1 Tax=Eleusine coracana subsp. coracana TaxID=191504 RepID=A0AAV5FKT4_ELECO|nr:hypothetical protein PR202_gb23733 [Eleusine coracana subsp. coracana]
MGYDFPVWAQRALEKVRRGYLWRGQKEAKGGHCLVAWDVVCCPHELGGLGTSNLKIMGWALHMCWLWLQKTEPHRPWSSLPIQVPYEAQQFFAMAVTSEVGNGAHMLYW